MKLTLLLLIVGMLQVSASVYSQTVKFSFNLQNQQVIEVLNEIEDNSEFRFFYQNEQINTNRLVSVKIEDATVEEILSDIFRDTEVSFRIMDEKLILLSLNSKTSDSGTTSQQGHKVTGTVTDTNGLALPGVTVLIKGTSNGTVTDMDGNYTIKSVSSDGILEFSFVGMETQEIPVAGKTKIDVILAESTIAIDEVVAIGYGVAKKSDLTGSLSSVSSDDIKKQPVTNLSQALQGRASGVVVSNNSGAPGGSVKIRIRGANSMLGSNDPLYIVDGVALNVSINDINVNDIESIEVLKDASSTAIYGSRGANGVILITTKRGKKEETKVQLTVNSGISRIGKKYDLLNAGDFAELVNQYKPDYFTDSEIAYYKANGGTDWQDEVFKTGITQDYQVSLTGGNEKYNYYFSGNYVDQTGIVTGAEQQKYSVRSNLSSKIGDKIKVDLNMYAARVKGVNNKEMGQKGVPLWNTPLFPATFPVYDEAGQWNRSDNLSGPGLLNPLMVLKEKYDDNLSNSVAFNSKFTYDILDGLKLDVVFGVDNNSTQCGSITNEWINPTSQSAALSEGKAFSWQNSNILTYQKTFADAHNLTVTAVNEQSKFVYNGFSATGSDISPISVGYNNLGIANGKNIGSYKSQYSLRSFLGRISYSFKNRYLLTLSYRADGTSKFQGDNKWGYFPSAAVAWRVFEESFMQNQNVISNLKLRGSWGKTGNQGINAYATIAQIGSISNTFGTTTFYPGSRVLGADNPDLKWETTEQKNIGIDIAAFDGRISLTADFYDKKTTDLLYAAAIPKYDGGGSVNKNIGEMQNRGFELTLSGTPISTRDFNWNASFNISAYKNKLISLGTYTFFLGNSYAAGLTPEAPFAVMVGESLGSFWGYEWQGVYKSSEATEAAKYGFKPGDNKYLDYNKDGVIDSADKHIIGNAMPKYVWGFDNSFSYKNFELNVTLQAVKGREILNTVYAGATTILSDATAISAVDGANYWTPENDDAKFASPTSSTNKNFIESTQFIEDGSYVKVKNVALAYNLSRNIVKFADLKFTLSAQNLFTFTKYKGYDPEASTSSNDIDGAIDVGAYPGARTFTFGVQANF